MKRTNTQGTKEQERKTLYEAYTNYIEYILFLIIVRVKSLSNIMRKNNSFLDRKNTHINSPNGWKKNHKLINLWFSGQNQVQESRLY